MKISIGAKIIEGPFGGGNAFIRNLAEYLSLNGIEVVNHLKDKDIDFILLVNPLIGSSTSTFDHLDILKYQKYVNPKSISIQRINECDERKKTNFVNRKIIESNKYVDITIFVSDWLKELFLDAGLHSENSFVIKGGPSRKLFNTTLKKRWNNNEKLKIVSHHWSGNWMKGFDTYKKIDQLISKKKWHDKIEFTYIGNLPNNFKFKNTNYFEPLKESDISIELKKHHLYVTGSINEPSGNHHMEAAMTGLPILYINSGGIPEYCNSFGVEFELENIEDSLENLIKNYDKYYENLKNYPYSFENAAKEFLNIIEYAENTKKSIYRKRNLPTKVVILKKFYLNLIYKNLFLINSELKKFLGKLKKISV
jgi:hypothetical protein